MLTLRNFLIASYKKLLTFWLYRLTFWGSIYNWDAKEILVILYHHNYLISLHVIVEFPWQHLPAFLPQPPQGPVQCDRLSIQRSLQSSSVHCCSYRSRPLACCLQTPQVTCLLHCHSILCQGSGSRTFLWRFQIIQNNRQMLVKGLQPKNIRLTLFYLRFWATWGVRVIFKWLLNFDFEPTPKIKIFKKFPWYFSIFATGVLL